MIISDRCTVEVEQDYVEFNLPRLGSQISITYIALGAMTIILIIMLTDLNNGQSNPTIGNLLGMAPTLIIITLLIFALRSLYNEWGKVRIEKSSNSIIWHRGDKEVGLWCIEDVQDVRTGWAFLQPSGFFPTRREERFSYFGQRERILYLKMSDGTQLRIAVGCSDALELVGRYLRGLGLPLLQKR